MQQRRIEYFPLSQQSIDPAVYESFQENDKHTIMQSINKFKTICLLCQRDNISFAVILRAHYKIASIDLYQDQLDQLNVGLEIIRHKGHRHNISLILWLTENQPVLLISWVNREIREKKSHYPIPDYPIIETIDKPVINATPIIKQNKPLTQYQFEMISQLVQKEMKHFEAMHRESNGRSIQAKIKLLENGDDAYQTRLAALKIGLSLHIETIDRSKCYTLQFNNKWIAYSYIKEFEKCLENLPKLPQNHIKHPSVSLPSALSLQDNNQNQLQNNIQPSRKREIIEILDNDEVIQPTVNKTQKITHVNQDQVPHTEIISNHPNTFFSSNTLLTMNTKEPLIPPDELPDDLIDPQENLLIERDEDYSDKNNVDPENDENDPFALPTLSKYF